MIRRMTTRAIPKAPKLTLNIPTTGTIYKNPSRFFRNAGIFATISYAGFTISTMETLDSYKSKDDTLNIGMYKFITLTSLLVPTTMLFYLTRRVSRVDISMKKLTIVNEFDKILITDLANVKLDGQILEVSGKKWHLPDSGEFYPSKDSFKRIFK